MPLTPAEALEAVLAEHAGAADRPGQRAMLAAIADAIASGTHLLVEAGTGTGKSLAYLVPAVLYAAGDRDDDEDDERRRVVVATATKALQEQLVGKDLPLVHDALAARGVEFRYAMLKGRGNYLCVAKVDAALDAAQAELAGPSRDLQALAWWAWTTDSGDRAELPLAVPDRTWGEVSTDALECPGARQCGFGDVCFAERARRRALAADVVVVNSHLYALDLETDGAVLPAHDVVVLDEAHAMEDVAASAFGASLGGGRVRQLAGRLRHVVAESDLADRVAAAGEDLADVLEEHEGRRVLPGTGELASVIARVRDLAHEAGVILEGIHPTEEAAVTRHQQVARLVAGLAADAQTALAVTDRRGERVAWVEGAPARRVLRVAPVDVGPLIAGRLPDGTTLVATSATLSVAGDFAPTAWRLGLRQEGTWTSLQVDSPFDYAAQALLYCAVHLPDPRQPGFVAGVHDELAALIPAAGGRTLSLFTSRRAMGEAADALRERLVGIDVLVQDERPRAQLVAALQSGAPTAVFATQSFWQGVDIPGSDVLLVTIDKLPFPPPTDPLFQARREAATAQGASSFATVDLARASTLLAQGVGRLIRTSTDRGVVAVFDRRLSFASYAWTLVRSLPPMRRTRERSEAVAFLEAASAAVPRSA